MRPFLKWAGGKQRLLKYILPLLPPGKRLIEPFVGSGAVFLETDFKQYLLADNNEELINVYWHLQKEGTAFVDYCQQFFVPKNNRQTQYYSLREQFNNTRDKRKKAALFVYLNRHCYNGLCRFNSSGKFNVPFGRYAKPYFPRESMQNFAERSSKAVFKVADFVATMRSAKKGDIIYCDPPYAPWSKTANFTQYSSLSFGKESQLRLVAEAEDLAKRGITVLISNHNNHYTQALYQKATLITFDVARMISRDAQCRQRVSELIAVYPGANKLKAI